VFLMHTGCAARQVDFLKLLYDKLDELHGIFAHTPHRHQFPRPLFKVVMLYVDEDTSITRQLERAKLASVHNKRVLDAGAGQLWCVARGTGVA
jgi:adenylate kinase